MKRYVHSSDVSNIIADLVGHIDLVIIANDARTLSLGNLPIVAAASTSKYSKYYDDFSKEELIDLDVSELRQIASPYALDLINDAVNDKELDYKLTNKQQNILSDFYSKRNNALINLSDSEIAELVNLISHCKSVTGPGYRPKQPEKNFAQLHGLKLVDDDYLAIVKSLKPSEFYGAVKSKNRDRLGIPLYEFKHDPQGYKLKYSGQTIPTDIIIYIKLIIDYDSDYNIAIVSFHDPEPDTLADTNED